MDHRVTIERVEGGFAFVCVECQRVGEPEPDREVARLDAHEHQRRLHPDQPVPVAVA
jgi:hypothetical protein